MHSSASQKLDTKTITSTTGAEKLPFVHLRRDRQQDPRTDLSSLFLATSEFWYSRLSSTTAIKEHSTPLVGKITQEQKRCLKVINVPSSQPSNSNIPRHPRTRLINLRSINDLILRRPKNLQLHTHRLNLRPILQ